MAKLKSVELPVKDELAQEQLPLVEVIARTIHESFRSFAQVELEKAVVTWETLDGGRQRAYLHVARIRDENVLSVHGHRKWPGELRQYGE